MIPVSDQLSAPLSAESRCLSQRLDPQQFGLLSAQRRIVDVPFLSSTVKGLRIRHVEGCADLQPLRQVRISQERFAERDQICDAASDGGIGTLSIVSTVHDQRPSEQQAQAIGGNDRAALANVVFARLDEVHIHDAQLVQRADHMAECLQRVRVRHIVVRTVHKAS